MTFSLVPTFLAASVPGNLVEIEDAVFAAETDLSINLAARTLRDSSVTVTSAIRWLNRRRAWVYAVLRIVRGALPELTGIEPTVTGFREALQVDSVLVWIRTNTQLDLANLPPPVGFRPRYFERETRQLHAQQRTGPDPPALAG